MMNTLPCRENVLFLISWFEKTKRVTLSSCISRSIHTLYQMYAPSLFSVTDHGGAGAECELHAQLTPEIHVTHSC